MQRFDAAGGDFRQLSRVQERFAEVSAAGVHLPQFMHLVDALALPPSTNGVAALGEAVLAGLRR